MRAFLRELLLVWRRQTSNWRFVVTHQVINRFLLQLAEQYVNIYVRMLGASPVELGWVRSSAGAASALVSVPLGIMHDRYSLRKIYLFGVALLAITPLIYATAPSWQFIVPAVFILGLGQRFGACAVICDVSLQNRDRATARAMCEGIGSTPTLVAPLLGALVVASLGGVSLSAVRPLFWFQFIARTALFAYMLKNLTEIIREPVKIEGEQGLWEGFAGLVRNGRALPQCLAYLAMAHVGKILLLTFMYPFAHEIKGAGALLIGGITAAMTLCEGVFATPFGRIADRIGRKRAYYLLLPLTFSGSVLLAFSPNQALLLFAGFLLGFRVITEVLLSALPAELVPSRYIGRWRGIIGLFMGLIAIPAPVIGGYIWESIGAQYVFLLVAVIDLLIVCPLVSSLPETADIKS